MGVVIVNTETCLSLQSWTGVETLFNAGFKAEAVTDIEVFSRDTGTGVDTLLTQTIHYNVVLLADGTVTIIPIALPPAPKTIVILRDTSALQGVDFADLGSFSPAVHTILHSRAAMRDAEDKLHRDRALLAPLGETLNDIPPAGQRAGLVLGFDGAGQPVAVAGGGGGGGGGAPTDAQYVVAQAHGLLTAERVLTNTATISWDFLTPGEAKATLANLAATKLFGRGSAGAGPPQEITLGTNLSMSGTTLNATGGGGGGTPGGAVTQVQFHDTGTVFAGDPKFVWDKANDSLGVGTPTPIGQLEINHEGIDTSTWGAFQAVGGIGTAGFRGLTITGSLNNSANFTVQTIGSDAQTLAEWLWYRARGTPAVPQPLLAATIIGQWQFAGKSPTNPFAIGAHFGVTTNADWSATSTPAQFNFATVPVGSVNGLRSLTIKNGGISVGFNSLALGVPPDTVPAAAGVVNAEVGFRVNNGAVVGTVLRGNGTNYVPGAAREVLTADRDIFVDAAGNDTTGTGAIGSPFLTIPRAVDAAVAFDLSIFKVTIRCSNVTRTNQHIVLKSYIGTGPIRIEGHPSAIPAAGNYRIQSALFDTCFDADGVRGDWEIRGFELMDDGVNGGGGVGASNYSFIRVGNLRLNRLLGGTGLGAHQGAKITNLDRSRVSLGNFAVDGNTNSFTANTLQGCIFIKECTVTVASGLTWGDSFTSCDGLSLQEWQTLLPAPGNIVGGAGCTGKRYIASDGGTIHTYGKGGSFFPGNSVEANQTNYGVSPFGRYS